MFRQPISWREFARLRQDMDRLFESSYPRAQRMRASSFPAMNVWTNENEGMIVTAELPGINPEDIDINVTVDTLTISGQREPGDLPETVKFHRQERSYGKFSRTFQLPFSVNKEKVEARVQNGVLQITLPRAEAEKPKQISVKAGQ